MIVIYKDYGLMDIPPVKFSSGQLSDSLTVQFDFSIWAITEYAWRLMELNGMFSKGVKNALPITFIRYIIALRQFLATYC